jgi:spore coat protein U-like protein
MRRARWLVSLAVLSVVLLVGARSASAQFCGVSATSVVFGTYNVFDNAPLASTGSVSYTCWLWPTIRIWLSRGSAPTNNPRQMVSGANRLSYNLYLDAAHTQVWGDPNPSQYGPIRIPFLFSQTTVTIYGQIPAGQDVPAGSYADTVTVTLNY